MTVWARIFVIPEVADVHLAYLTLIRQAEEIVKLASRGALSGPARASLRQLRRSYVEFNDAMEMVAQRASVDATTSIRARLASTQLRADTRSAPHLRDLIYCRPLTTGSVQTGMVGVARVSTLQRAVNPNTPGYGTYWRAQEYGTGRGEVKSQVGRVLFGFFASSGGGDLTPPQSQFGGGGGGPHPIFLPKRARGGLGPNAPGRSRLAKATGKAQGAGGWGTIGAEIQPRYFIRRGADPAAMRWREQIAKTQQRAIDEIAAITV